MLDLHPSYTLAEATTSMKDKEQILQEEAGLAEAIRLDALEKALEKEEVAKQVHLDSLLAQRMAEEQELTEEQKKRKAQVQFEAQSYTEEDWDTIRAKLEANAELRESVLGKDLTIEDYAKRMVELNQGDMAVDSIRRSWNFDEKEKFEEFGEVASKTNTAKKQSFDDESTQTNRGVLKFPINPVPVATKSPSIANYKIIKQGRKGVYQIVRENGTDMSKVEFEKVLWRLLEKNVEEPLLKYPLSAEVCKAMLDKKLQGGKPDEDCYKLLKMMEKQAGIRK
ncbi:hypothetical protein Tco_0257679 [Tanacetum coccineum]